MIVNDRFSWDSHVNKILKSANQRMYCMRILKPLVSPDEMRAIYFLLIRILLEYCSLAFVHLPATLEKMLARFQNRAQKLS